eukprot:268285_1
MTYLKLLLHFITLRSVTAINTSNITTTPAPKPNASIITTTAIPTYSIPIKTNQFIIPNKTITIKCGTLLTNQLNVPPQLVSYYNFSVTQNMYSPIIINSCPYLPDDIDSGDFDPDDPFNYTEEINEDDFEGYLTRIYIIQKFASGEIIQMTKSDGINYGDGYCDVDVSDLQQGNNYYAVLQGTDNSPGNFSLSMTCAPPSVLLSKQVVMGLVFGFCALLLLIFIIHYIYTWHMYCKEQKVEKQTNTNNLNKMSSYSATNKGILIPQHDEYDNVDIDIDIDVMYSQFCFCCPVYFEKNIDETDLWVQQKINARVINQDEEFINQLKYNEDVIQLVLLHAIQCCEDRNGFDIYQCLALRFYDKESRKVRSVRPFYKIGFNAEFIAISPFIRTLLIATIIALAQTLGIGVVVYRLFYQFFTFEVNDEFFQVCDMNASRWNELWSLKVLSFLMSLVITFYVSVIMDKMHNGGLYAIFYYLTVNDMLRVDGMVLWIIQIGQIINYWVCLLAVVGSYFIIYHTNQPQEMDNGLPDYSSSGLDMILNAVALFFMLELDDIIISAKDFKDSKSHLEYIIKSYYPNTNINQKYAVDFEEINCCSFRHHSQTELYSKHDQNNNSSNSYISWSADDVIHWIISLDDGFKKYEDDMRKIFKQQNIDGSYLAYVDNSDLLSWNITDCKDRIFLLKQLKKIDTVCYGSGSKDRNIDECKDKEIKEELKIDDYMNWNGENVVNWIISLDSYRYKKYLNELMNCISKYNINGLSLISIEKYDLRKWGVTDINDRNKIYQEIRIEIQNKHCKCCLQWKVCWKCNCCLQCVVPVLYMIISVGALFVKICCYGFGFVAPFVIFFCW